MKLPMVLGLVFALLGTAAQADTLASIKETSIRNAEIDVLKESLMAACSLLLFLSRIQVSTALVPLLSLLQVGRRGNSLFNKIS